MSETPTPIVMCRTAPPQEPLVPTFALGYSCRACGTPLQVSRDGVKRIRDLGGVPVCQSCGRAVLKEAATRGKLAEIHIGPHATAQIEDMTDKSILDTFPDAQTEILEEEDE